ncbi:MAG: STN domain-containing protein [Acidobacteria bacterium]|nr:STN domain-containing protein [Acidobacteriota bacterium]
MKSNLFRKFSALTRFLSLFCFMTCVLIVKVSGQGCAENAVLDREITLRVEKASFVFVLSELIINGVVIGFEKSLSHSDEKKITLDVRNKPLRDVLNEILKFESGYVFEATDGILYIYPNRDRSEFLKSLLENDIGSIRVANQPDRFANLDRLLELPEIKRQMADWGVTRSVWGTTYHPTPDRRQKLIFSLRWLISGGFWAILLVGR